jgi:glycosyltransferase involved in cell wall biosynthesis
VARLHPVKDQETLIRGFAAVARSRDDVDLLLVGDGPLRGDLEQMVEGLRLSGRVQFLGIRPDVPEILRCAEAFVLTSLSEAASLSLLEAMASGLPSVVTDVGGNSEMVRDRLEGFLVPRGDHASIASAILRLLDHPAEAAVMGDAARSRVEEQYQLDRTIDTYMDLYRDLTRPAARP